MSKPYNTIITTLKYDNFAVHLKFCQCVLNKSDLNKHRVLPKASLVSERPLAFYRDQNFQKKIFPMAALCLSIYIFKS